MMYAFNLTAEQVSALAVELTHRKKSKDWMDAPLEQVLAKLAPVHAVLYNADFNAFDRSFHSPTKGQLP